MNHIVFDQVDIVFGARRTDALRQLDRGGTREDILKSTGAVIGVADASLTVEEGEICVLMGLSGSGKSTLLRAVNGLNKVSRGRVLLRHRGEMVNVAAIDAGTLRAVRTESVAMVFQQFALLPWRTVRDNVGLGLELRGVAKAERDRIVDEKLNMVQLDPWADKYAHELSGGMQQRVGLARAFATDASLLLMDEPFSALDPLIRTKLQDELLSLQRNLKKTILFVSHDLDEAMKIGNRIAIMEGGRIVQMGTPEDIILRPANAYVAEFVAHMNPLNVLKAGSIMRPLTDCAWKGDQVYIDNAHTVSIQIDAQGRVFENNGPEIMYSAPHATLKDIILLKQQGCEAVGIVDESRKLLGICTDREIFAGLTRENAHSVVR